MDVDPLCHTALGENWLRVFEPSLSLVGWAIWCRQVLQSGPARRVFVRNCHFLLPTGQACELELSFWSIAFQLISSFSKVVKCGGVFTRLQLSYPTFTQSGSAQYLPYPTRQMWIVPYIYLDKGLQSANQQRWTMWFFWEQVMCHAHLVGCRFT
jgi:hypothetical protein